MHFFYNTMKFTFNLYITLFHIGKTLFKSLEYFLQTASTQIQQIDTACDNDYTLIPSRQWVVKTDKKLSKIL